MIFFIILKAGLPMTLEVTPKLFQLTLLSFSFEELLYEIQSTYMD